MLSIFVKHLWTLIPSLIPLGFTLYQWWRGNMNIMPPLWIFWALLGAGIIGACLLTYREIKKDIPSSILRDKELLSEARETLLKLHASHSGLAEQIASNITFDQVKDAYTNLILLYQSQGKMQNISVSEPDRDTRQMLEQAFNTLKLKSAYNKDALTFISSMVWGMKDQSIKLELASDTAEYILLKDTLIGLRAKLPKYDKQIVMCVNYSYKLNCWYALTIWMQTYKDKLPPDLRIAIVQNKDLMDDFIGELVSKVGK
jgi:hypothetical protein